MIKSAFFAASIAAVLAVFTTFAGSPRGADAAGPTPASLSAAGWSCFNVPGLGVHCQPPGSGQNTAVIQFLYFAGTSDPANDSASLTGTETLIRADLYRGQPCKTEGKDSWTGLDLFGGPEIDYYACHHR